MNCKAECSDYKSSLIYYPTTLRGTPQRNFPPLSAIFKLSELAYDARVKVALLARPTGFLLHEASKKWGDWNAWRIRRGEKIYGGEGASTDERKKKGNNGRGWHAGLHDLDIWIKIYRPYTRRKIEIHKKALAHADSIGFINYSCIRALLWFR